MNKHALLSASSSHRWLNCPPSARLCESYTYNRSEFAAEGTDAHSLCEYRLKKALGIPATDPTPDLTYYNEEMSECADGYVAYILELLSSAKQTCTDPQILIEQRLDFSKYVQDGFGTGDCVIIADETLHITDYKHGQGILVEATDNPQMKLYGLGALAIFDGIYDISTVSMHIYQPRRNNVSTYTESKKTLYQWAEEVLKPIAELAYAGTGEFQCGQWCRFCTVKHNCRARAESNLKLAQYDFQLPALLAKEEIETILSKVDELVSWATDIKDYALQQALKGAKFNGFKIVEGRANRRYTDENTVAAIVSGAGFDPYEQKVLGITAMTSLLGKQRFEELLNGYIEKPQGKPALVQDTDKRPAINSAQQDFIY